LLNILCIPLVCNSSLSLMPMILRFGLLIESLSSYIFFSQLLSYLLKHSIFSSISILFLSPDSLSSIFSSLLGWQSLYFLFD
jgi:hypothetical protein